MAASCSDTLSTAAGGSSAAGDSAGDGWAGSEDAAKIGVGSLTAEGASSAGAASLVASLAGAGRAAGLLSAPSTGTRKACTHGGSLSGVLDYAATFYILLHQLRFCVSRRSEWNDDDFLSAVSQSRCSPGSDGTDRIVALVKDEVAAAAARGEWPAAAAVSCCLVLTGLPENLTMRW